MKPEIIELNLKRMKKDKMRLKQQVIMNMKDKFKHIYGMWPATAHFIDEHHRMEAWQTSLVIKRKIFDPSKCLIQCKKGADLLQIEQQKQVDFLDKFKGKPKPRKMKFENIKNMSQTGDEATMEGSIASVSRGTIGWLKTPSKYTKPNTSNSSQKNLLIKQEDWQDKTSSGSVSDHSHINATYEEPSIFKLKSVGATPVRR